jgi:NAD(P)-dependent dehydrogenase (short-subunit alcohol dehydrogenase family)
VEITVLGATGATGAELTRQALARGHSVTAIARNPDRITLPPSGRLTRVAGDVLDPGSIGRALKGARVVVSGLGISGKDAPGALTAGARAAVDAGPDFLVWLAAFGTGNSAPHAGAFTRGLLKTFMKSELDDRTSADATVRAAGGAVFHAGPLSNGPLSPTRRTVSLDDAPRRIFPARVSRATVAAAMLDEAEQRRYGGRIAVPIER